MNISVIIRTKNEEEWLRRCLTGVTNQDYPNVETIVVDSGSSDRTLEIVKKFDVKLLHYKGIYLPGKALNMGVTHSKGELVAFLSAHCIPLNDKWLERLAACFHDPLVAAAYGRQEPLPDSSATDKRDLWTVFGKEARIQKKDYFFHNANSMIRRDVWNKIKFDETLPSIEDQAWAKKVIALDRTILYEPHASVYHHHGIHQGLEKKRAERVVKVIDLLKRSGDPW